VDGTLRACLTVAAEDEDDAAEAAVEVICDRVHRLDRVSASSPRCADATEAGDPQLDPDTD
jgi:hypothetical protein